MSRLVLLVAVVVDLGLGTSGGGLQTGSQETAAVSELGLPQPKLDRVDPAVRRQLTEKRQELQTLIDRHPEPAELAQALADLGKLYLAYDLLEPAEACLLEARRRIAAVRGRRVPGEASWLYLLGYLYQERGQPEKAMEMLEDSLEAKPDQAAALLRLGHLYREAGRPERAVPLYERALSVDASCVAARYGLGEMASQRRDFETALGHLEEALRRRPDSVQIRYRLAMVLRHLGRRRESSVHLRQVDLSTMRSGIWWGCPDPLVTALADLTVGSPVHLLRGAEAAQLGASQVELDEYRKAVAANPQDPVARESLGSALYRQGDLAGAAEQYRHAVRLDPGNASFHHDLGQVLLSQGAPEEATASFRTAVALHPNFKAANLKLANLYQQNGQFVEAVPHYRRVVAVDPLNVQARVQMAMALLRLDRRQEAIEELGRLLDDHPPKDPAEHLMLATMVGTVGDPQRALKHFLAIADSQAQATVRAQAHARIGQIRLLEGRPQAAVESFGAALALDPQLEEAKGGLARARTFLPD